MNYVSSDQVNLCCSSKSEEANDSDAFSKKQSEKSENVPILDAHRRTSRMNQRKKTTCLQCQKIDPQQRHSKRIAQRQKCPRQKWHIWCITGPTNEHEKNSNTLLVSENSSKTTVSISELHGVE